jgi:hypothetical protein
MKPKIEIRDHRGPITDDPLLEKLIPCHRCETVDNPIIKPRYRISNRMKKDDNGRYQPHDYVLQHMCSDAKSTSIDEFTREELVNKWNNLNV